MKKLYTVLATLALAATGAFAAAGDTWLLNSYATDAADSATTNALYGYQTFENKGSSVTINVTGGSVNLVATKLGSDGTEGYTANIGELLPLTPDWSEHDLTGLTSITFDYQNDQKITDVLSVSFGSTAYSTAISNAGTVYSNDIAGSAALGAGTTWKSGEVLISDFATPSWWTTIPTDFPSIDTVLKHVKNLQFAPKSLYTASGTQAGVACTKCVTPTMTSVTLKVKNIVLHGVKASAWPNAGLLGCEDAKPQTLFGDFLSAKNALGGYWFTFSDFDSLGTSTDPAKGATAVSDSIFDTDGYMMMSANLKKKDGTFHKYAGWADIGTNFPKGVSMDATGLTGIGFLLLNSNINANLVQNIIFKVKVKGVNDTALHQVLLPTADIVAAAAAGKVACIRPSDLAQPSYVVAADKKPFDASKIVQFAWEAKITDDRTPTIDTATANLILSSVILYGTAAPVLNKDPTDLGVLGHARTKTAVSYANGALQLSGFVGATHFEVRDLDGKVVSTFAASQRVSLSLPRGTYLLTPKGSSASKKFAVVGR
jgi:hypothetical protein